MKEEIQDILISLEELDKALSKVSCCVKYLSKALEQSNTSDKLNNES